MTVKWKNRRKVRKGQYRNPKHGMLTKIAVEPMCNSNLYFWHLFAGRSTTKNDFTVVENSPLFSSILNGRRTMKLPEGHFADGFQRNWRLYYQVDGIRPLCSVFLKLIHTPINIQQQAMRSME